MRGQAALHDLVASARQRRTRQPVVVLASDDWGQSAVPDRAAFDRAARRLGIGGHPFDHQGLESPEDVDDLTELLARHCDSRCRPAVLSAFFIMANVDPAVSLEAGRPVLRPIDEGWPGVDDPGRLWRSYREATGAGVMSPGFHGYAHCNVRLLETALERGGERAARLRELWKAGIPYLPSVTPWAAFAYENAWDLSAPAPESVAEQRRFIEPGVAAFRRLFGEGRSTCAPGYRSYPSTMEMLRTRGFDSFQSGQNPGIRGPIRLGDGNWSVARNTSFEMAIIAQDGPDRAFARAETLLKQGFPAVLSMHSINLQSGVRDHKSGTLFALDRLLTLLERRFRSLAYAAADELPGLLSPAAPLRDLPWAGMASHTSALAGFRRRERN